MLTYKAMYKYLDEGIHSLYASVSSVHLTSVVMDGPPLEAVSTSIGFSRALSSASNARDVFLRLLTIHPRIHFVL